MNNCLIIAHPRSGSTNLMKSITSGNNIKYCFEPFGAHRGNLNGNKCVKVIVGRKTNEFYINLCKSFEKVILLARRDTNSAAESLTKLYANGGYAYAPWVSLTETEKLKVPEYIEKIDRDKDNLAILSKALDIPIDYYEDVYTNMTLLDTSIKLDVSYLDNSKKLKKTKLNIL